MAKTSTEAVKQWRARQRAAGLSVHSPARLAKQSAWLKETYYALRGQLYEIVGQECVGCGHQDIRVLEFDHIYDDGADDRRRFKGARSMLQYFVENPDEARRRLQVLCRNCNWLKRKGHEYHIGKKYTGRMLDGRTWDELPSTDSASTTSPERTMSPTE